MKSLLAPLTFLAACLAFAPLAGAQDQKAATNSQHKVANEPRDYWPGKYVKLPGNVKEPAKLTFVNITKEGAEYRIEGLEGRQFKMSNMNRSLTEFPASATDDKALARLGLGTATLRTAGIEQIVIDVFVGGDHYYLIRAEPLREVEGQGKK